MLLRAATSLAGTQRLLDSVPESSFTPSWLIRRAASLVAAVASGASATTQESFLPPMPPRSLTMSRTISMPLSWRRPSAAIGPLNGCRIPILISPWDAASDASPALAPIIASSATSRMVLCLRVSAAAMRSSSMHFGLSKPKPRPAPGQARVDLGHRQQRLYRTQPRETESPLAGVRPSTLESY